MRISCYAQASGRVQGVGFRYFVLREATQRGIGGWVRNCEDGSVQMLLQGEEEAVQLLLPADSGRYGVDSGGEPDGAVPG